jgi:RNase P protein component
MEREAEPGLDYVVIGRRETLRRPFPELLADLAGALRKLADNKAQTRRSG